MPDAPPGAAIQSHALLLIVTEADLVIRQASVNVEHALGRPVAEVVGLSLECVLAPGSIGAVRAALAGMEPGGIAETTATVPGWALGAACQAILRRADGMVMCELEPAGEAAERRSESFVRAVSRAMTGIRQASGVRTVAARAVEDLKRITGYDRVTVHRFDHAGHGEVIADAREPSMEPLLGLRYAAGEVLAETRELLCHQRVRLVADYGDRPAEIWPRENALTGRPVDPRLIALRPPIALHRRVMLEQGVGATLTIALSVDGGLWGIVACYHRSPRRIELTARAACDFLGELLAFVLAREQQSDAERHSRALRATQTRLRAALDAAPALAEGLRGNADPMLALCAADGVSVALLEERITAGTVPDAAAEGLILQRLVPRRVPTWSDRLDAPAGMPEELCGALVVGLEPTVGRFVAFYRGQWRREATWDVPHANDGPGAAQRSFEAWLEAVDGQSPPWEPEQVAAAAGFARSLAELAVAAMREQLAHVALHDSLTGLPNRALLLETLAQILRRRPRAGPEYAGLLFLDLDNFKQVNDSLGHRAGDLLLQQAAQRIGESLRYGDVVGRLGGDEFVVVLQGINNPSELAPAAERIQHQFHAPFELEGIEKSVGVSIGIAWADLNQQHTPADLMRDADTAMYEAKRGGRGRSIEFRAELDESRRRRSELERHLEGALDRGELRLDYQPVFTAQGRLAGLEALARWDGPLLGRVAPTEFIPVAEEVGIIEEIGAWVLEEALARLAILRDLGGLELSMAVNLSSRQLSDQELPGRLDELTARMRIPRELVCLEIPEEQLAASGGRGMETLARLRTMGARVAIDDFGAGLSALPQLHRLPADMLKIAPGFIAELDRDRVDAATVGAIIDLARRLGIRTVAEGVETEEQLRILRGLACDLLQGFLLARPQPGEGLEALLNGGSRH